MNIRFPSCKLFSTLYRISRVIHLQRCFGPNVQHAQFSCFHRVPVGPYSGSSYTAKAVWPLGGYIVAVRTAQQPSAHNCTRCNSAATPTRESAQPKPGAPLLWKLTSCRRISPPMLCHWMHRNRCTRCIRVPRCRFPDRSASRYRI